MRGDAAVFERRLQVVQGDDAEPGKRGGLRSSRQREAPRAAGAARESIHADVDHFRSVEDDVAKRPVK